MKLIETEGKAKTVMKFVSNLIKEKLENQREVNLWIGGGLLWEGNPSITTNHSTNEKDRNK
jgi:hypothetical protein